MDDFEYSFSDFPFLPGIDLTLWVQLVAVVLATVAGITGLAFLLS